MPINFIVLLINNFKYLKMIPNIKDPKAESPNINYS